MASYAEIRVLFNHSDLQDRLQVACIVAAETVRIEDPGTTNHANRLAWAKRAFTDPSSAADAMLKALLAANRDFTVAQMTGADDAAMQAKVDAAVDIFADGA